jgi:hypothetical protein
MKMIEGLYAAWKYLLSFRKSDWELGDYPIRFRDFGVPPVQITERLKMVAWEARIINWPMMMGSGDTPEEALADLAKRFNERKASDDPLPRPGCRVPLEEQIDFAPDERITARTVLVADFLKRIFDMDYRKVWLSDQSTIWHLHYPCDDEDEPILEKIRRIYGVDVSDLEDGIIADIIERIASSPPGEAQGGSGAPRQET